MVDGTRYAAPSPRAKPEDLPCYGLDAELKAKAGTELAPLGARRQRSTATRRRKPRPSG